MSDPCAQPVRRGRRRALRGGGQQHDDSTQLKERLGGNSDAEAREGGDLHAGVVYQPSYLPGFSATIDYYNVAIRKAIGTIGAARPS